MSTQDETFRATLRARTPEGDITTLIVLRRGLGHAARVWLTFDQLPATGRPNSARGGFADSWSAVWRGRSV